MEWEFGLVDANQKEKKRSDCLTKLIILPQTSMHICVCVCLDRPDQRYTKLADHKILFISIV